MRRSLAGLLIVLTCVCCKGLRAQNSLWTGADRSYVLVRDHDGLLNFWYEKKKILSFQYKSFLSVKVAGKIYTNNDLPPAGTEYLGVATLEQHEDSLIVTWQKDGFEISQIAYPSQTQDGMKIGVRFFVRNTGTSTITAGSQYILDLSVGGHDGSQSLTPLGGPDEGWHYFKPFIPSHVVFPENRLPNAPTFDPGAMAIATLIDELYPLPTPNKLLIGHWPTIERLAYLDTGFVPPPFLGEIDQSMLAQWPDRSVGPNTTVEVGGFYFGAADHSYCMKESSALLLAPPEMETGFPAGTIHKIPAYLFNYTNTVSKDVVVTARTTGALKFPDGTRTRDFAIGDLARDSSKMISIPLVIDTSSGVLSAKVSLTVKPDSSDVGYCETTIFMTPTETDHGAPTAIVLSRQHGENCRTRVDTLLLRDNGSGITSVVTAVENYKQTLLTPSTYPRSEAQLRFAVIDTMLDAIATVTAIDGMENAAAYEIKYCTTPDMLPPLIRSTFDDLTNSWTITLTDDRPWDRRLNNISVYSRSNIVVQDQGEVKGSPTHILTVTTLDTAQPASFCVTGIDLAGNVSDTCIERQPADVGKAVGSMELSLYPNPANDVLWLRGPIGSRVEILDLLGRLMNDWRWLSETSIDVKPLPSGRYFLTAGDRTIPFSIEH